MPARDLTKELASAREQLQGHYEGRINGLIAELEAQKSIIETSYIEKHEKLIKQSAQELEACRNEQVTLKKNLTEETTSHTETKKKLTDSLAEQDGLRKTISQRDSSI